MKPAATPRLLVALAIAGAATAASARPVHYQCTGYQPLDAELNPRDGQVHFQGQDWKMRRVHDDREARYVGGAKGVSVTITMRQGAMTLRRGTDTFECKLITDGLAGFGASAPAAASTGTPGR